MAVELTDIIAQLSPSGQLIATITAGIGFGILGVWQFYSTHKSGKKEKEAEKQSDAGEHFDPEDLLESSPFLKMLAAFEAMAQNAALSAAHQAVQAEALKTISAATTVWAKTREADFDEWRIQRAVDARFDAWMKRHQGGPPPAGGWGA